jgi:ribose 5-phosphate isomerase A
MVSFAAISAIDVSIDGADEVDRDRNLVKGGGGALLREKMVAYHTKTYLVIVDESKLVDTLGKFPLPVEILPFAAELTLKVLGEFGEAKLRQSDGRNFLTDNGNFIADLNAYPIADPQKLDARLRQIPGVLETGLFSHTLVTHVLVGTKTGEVKTL